MNGSKSLLLFILLILIPLLVTACFKTNKNPIASFTTSPTSGEAPLEVTFTATNSYDPDGSIVSFEWNFRDGSSGSGETIIHTFTSQGNYNVKLTVTDDKGVTDSVSKTITVTEPQNQPPTASFTANPASGEVPLEVTFNAYDSHDPDGYITNYNWDFNDGDIGTGAYVTHTFISKGEYNVELIVTDNEGATNSITHTVSVKEVTYYQVGETVNNGCIKFTLRSVSKADSISLWTPDPGNHYVIVDVKIEAVNNGQFASMLFNSELEDDERRVYDVSAATSALDHYFDSANLDAGQWTDGKSAYEANKNSAFYILIYEDILSGCPAIKYKFSI